MSEMASLSLFTPHVLLHGHYRPNGQTPIKRQIVPKNQEICVISAKK